MSETTSIDTIEVNGERQPFGARTIAALLAERGIEPAGRGLAVAHNGAVVPRIKWGETALAPGDTVEIVQAKQGG